MNRGIVASSDMTVSIPSSMQTHHIGRPQGYDQSFGWEQYELLAKVMAESKGKVMLSINDHPDIRELFKRFPYHSTWIGLYGRKK